MFPVSTYGFSAGIGISIPMGKHYLIIKADYKHGLVPVYDYMDELSNNYFRITTALDCKTIMS